MRHLTTLLILLLLENSGSIFSSYCSCYRCFKVFFFFLMAKQINKRERERKVRNFILFSFTLTAIFLCRFLSWWCIRLFLFSFYVFWIFFILSYQNYKIKLKKRDMNGKPVSSTHFGALGLLTFTCKKIYEWYTDFNIVKHCMRIAARL